MEKEVPPIFSPTAPSAFSTPQRMFTRRYSKLYLSIFISFVVLLTVRNAIRSPDEEISIPTLQIPTPPEVSREDDLPSLHVPSQPIDTIDIQEETDLHKEEQSVLSENRGPPKVGKVHMIFGDLSQMYERAIISHQKHADEMGHPIFLLREKLLGGLWSKPAHLMSVILTEMSKSEEERLKWIL
jgi:hypothetical protein